MDRPTPTERANRRILREWRLHQIDDHCTRADLARRPTSVTRRLMQWAAAHIIRFGVQRAARAHNQTRAHVLARLLDKELT